MTIEGQRVLKDGTSTEWMTIFPGCPPETIPQLLEDSIVSQVIIQFSDGTVNIYRRKVQS